METLYLQTLTLSRWQEEVIAAKEYLKLTYFFASILLKVIQLATASKSTQPQEKKSLLK